MTTHTKTMFDIIKYDSSFVSSIMYEMNIGDKNAMSSIIILLIFISVGLGFSGGGLSFL